MFLISSDDVEDVLKVAANLDYLDKFVNLDLKEINSLELIEIAPESISWTLGEPLVFDETSGIVIMSYSTNSLEWLKKNIGVISPFGVTEESVTEFCRGEISQLFCLDTF